MMKTLLALTVLVVLTLTGCVVPCDGSYSYQSYQSVYQPAYQPVNRAYYQNTGAYCKPSYPVVPDCYISYTEDINRSIPIINNCYRNQYNNNYNNHHNYNQQHCNRNGSGAWN